MLDRRSFLTGVAGIIADPLATAAQQAGKVHRIGFLSAAGPSGGQVEGLRHGLREQGYVENQTLLIEWKFTEGRRDRLPGLAAEFVRSKVEVMHPGRHRVAEESYLLRG